MPYADSLPNDIAKLFDEYKELSQNVLDAQKVINAQQIVIERAQRRMEEINTLIRKSPTVLMSGLVGSYNFGWSNLKKASFVIQSRGECISAREIVESILAIEEKRGDAQLRRALQKTLSSTLNAKVKNNELFGRYRRDGSDWLYGLIEWFEGEELKQESMTEG